MAPFQYQSSHDSRVAGSISDIMLRRGEIAAQQAQQVGNAQARAAEVGGNAWGNAINTIGQTVAAIPGQMQHAKQQATRADADAMALADMKTQRAAGQRDTAAMNSALPKGRVAALQALESNPALYKKAQDHFNAIDDNYKRLMGSVAAGVREFGDSPQAAMTALDDLEAQGFDAKKLTPLRTQITEHPEHIAQLVDGLLKQSPDEAHRALVKPTKAPQPLMNVDPAHDVFDPNTREVVKAGVPKVEPAKVETRSLDVQAADALARGDKATYDRLLKVKKEMGQADDRPRITVNTGGSSNVKDVIAGMRDGTIPPQMPGRASKEYVELLAEAHRQGYDLAGAVTDWSATQKHVATMNGAQQLRLNQAVNALPDMLDKVDALASQWKGGRFPLLNKGNLMAAKAGAYGKDVASIATQLDAQIADVTADLGNVYMGGNSPTDHALGLAGKSLNGEWDEKVLHDMVKLAKSNVTIRQNSIKSTGVAGASANNPYAAPAAPSAGLVRMRAPNGQETSVPADQVAHYTAKGATVIK